MGNDTPGIPRIPREPTTRRSLGYSAIIGLAQDLIIARFALSRALDRLQTEDLLQVLDELQETVDGPNQRWRHLSVTPRDENE